MTALSQYVPEKQWRRTVAERIGQPSLATDATTGFLYVPTCAGTPTGTPATQTGLAPMIVDDTNHRLYFWSGGVWRNAGP